MNAPLPQAGSVPLLDTEVLRSFVAIAESGSFTRAANQVFRTPSALSMQIKRLEETLHTPLFVREARQVRLTPEGEVLLGYGRRMLKLNEEAVSQFLAPALSGTVRFGTPDGLDAHVLPSVLAQFARTHPAVQVNVIVGKSMEMLERLDAGELDLAVANCGSPGAESARGVVLRSEPLFWVGREGGCAVQRNPLPVTLASQGCIWRSMALAALDQAGIPYRVAYTSEHCAGKEAAVLADLAVAPFPASLVRPPLRRLGDDAGLPPLGNYRIVLVRRRGADPACEALAGHVEDAFKSLRA